MLPDISMVGTGKNNQSDEDGTSRKKRPKPIGERFLWYLVNHN